MESISNEDIINSTVEGYPTTIQLIKPEQGKLLLPEAVIKNVVFDIGNVLLRFAALDVVKAIFPEEKNSLQLTKQIFKTNSWDLLNEGKLQTEEWIIICERESGIPRNRLLKLFTALKEAFVPIPGSLELLNDLFGKVNLYCITDSVNEIVSFLKVKYQEAVFNKFQGVIVSAEVGITKPSSSIYKHLLKKYSLNAAECVFIDDNLQNVESARQVGMYGVHFTSAENCRKILEKCL